MPQALVESNCIHCNVTIYVNEQDKQDMGKNLCYSHGGPSHWGAWTPTWVKKCECGAKAAGTDSWGHSRWCPVWEDKMNPKKEKSND
jgi:hypothetical protein